MRSVIEVSPGPKWAWDASLLRTNARHHHHCLQPDGDLFFGWRVRSGGLLFLYCFHSEYCAADRDQRDDHGRIPQEATIAIIPCSYLAGNFSPAQVTSLPYNYPLYYACGVDAAGTTSYSVYNYGPNPARNFSVTVPGAPPSTCPTGKTSPARSPSWTRIRP